LDYLVTPFRSLELRKALLRYERNLSSVRDQKDLLPVNEDAFVEVPEILDAPHVEIEEGDSVNFDTEGPKVISGGEDKPLIICVKSHGDYRFIEAKNIWYLQADNNSTDIHLKNGEMITAFKTLKQFESALPFPFARIHNSYIVNIDYVSRIHMGNSVCYLKDSTNKLPFSKSYKENVDAIINSITNGNYLEF